jgi:hypothetical protein
VFNSYILYYFFRLLVYMRFNKLLETTIILCLFIATVGTAYIFVVTIIFHDTTYAGFYSSWQFPMLFAIFIDSTFYKHLNRLNSM